MSAEIRLVAYDAASPLLERGLEVYARVWPERDQAEARESFTRYAGYRDFRGLVAFRGDEAVGVAYGACSYPGVWWHDVVVEQLGHDHPALQHAWRLVELAVVEEARQLGIGGCLHDTVIASQPCPRVLLTTSVSNLRARGIYERRGWQYVHHHFEFPGQPYPHVIMGRARQP